MLAVTTMITNQKKKKIGVNDNYDSNINLFGFSTIYYLVI